jgi:hypothetical protein
MLFTNGYIGLLPTKFFVLILTLLADFAGKKRVCAAKAIFYCPSMNSHRPRSQNTAYSKKGDTQAPVASWGAHAGDLSALDRWHA